MQRDASALPVIRPEKKWAGLHRLSGATAIRLEVRVLPSARSPTTCRPRRRAHRAQTSSAHRCGEESSPSTSCTRPASDPWTTSSSSWRASSGIRTGDWFPSLALSASRRRDAVGGNCDAPSGTATPSPFPKEEAAGNNDCRQLWHNGAAKAGGSQVRRRQCRH